MVKYIIRTDTDMIKRTNRSSNVSNDENSITFFIQNSEDWMKPELSKEIDEKVKMINKVVFEVCVGEGETDFALSSDIDSIKYMTNIIENDLLQRKVICNTDNEKKAITCYITKPKRSVRLTLYDIHTTAAVGETKIEVYVNGKQQESAIPDGVIIIKKQDSLPQIQAFWPDKGAICTGDKVILQYHVENVSKLQLDDGEKIIPLSITSHQQEVMPSKTTKYTLIADNIVMQSFPVIVNDAYLNYFKVENDMLMWSVYCAKQYIVNGVIRTEPEGSLDISELPLPTIITLEAKGQDVSFISKLYIGNDTKKDIIPHFQKTILKIGNHHLVQVSWKTHTLDKLTLIYKDRERFEIFPLFTNNVNEKNEYGEWEQLIPGKYIDITMEAVENGASEPFYITL